MPCTAILQARMGSTRRPGKVLLPAVGKPLLALLLERLEASSRLEQVVIATTELERDDPIADFAAGRDPAVPCYRGSEEDVLDRYYQAALRFEADPVVRITGDCPLIDPAVVDRVIAAFEESGLDYAGTNHPPSFPDGLDTEVFSFAALEQAWREAPAGSPEREHVTPFIYSRPERFRLGNLAHEEDLSRTERWTLDYEEDYQLIRAVFEALYDGGRIFHLGEIKALLDARPDLRQLNVQYLPS